MRTSTHNLLTLNRISIIAAALMILFILCTCGCSQKPGILHSIKPEPAPHVEIVKDRCARIRTRMADVTVEPAGISVWKIFLKHKRFTRKDAHPEYRYPKLFFFKMVITNHTKKPVTIDNVTITTAHDTLNPLEIKEVKKKCKSPAFSIYNFDALLSPYRLLTDVVCLEKINIARDLIPTKFEFIPPGDTIMQMVAFSWIPVENRTFTLSVTLKRGNEKKVVDFKMRRIEYRTRGSHFREKPGDKK
ncbi:MAG: hypothetical protein ACOCX9_07595 [Spirochaetota bacterium]